MSNAEHDPWRPAVVGRDLSEDSQVTTVGPFVEPAAWAAWANALDDSVSLFEAQGVTIPLASHRLRQSAEFVRACAQAERLPDVENGETILSNAARNARDFVEIASCLGTSPSRETRNEIAQALVGSLGEREPDQKPYQLQSSLWFGTVLHRAGLAPRRPSVTRGQPNPDYLVERGTMTYGIEVKRCASWRALVTTHLPKALGQLRAVGVRGAIALDVTEMVRGVSFESIGSAVRDCSNRLESVIHTPDRGYNAGYDAVMVSVVYARGALRVIYDPTRDVHVIKEGNAVWTQSYCSGGSRCTLADIHALWLRDAIRRTIRAERTVPPAVPALR
jgi:hypothetical protein